MLVSLPSALLDAGEGEAVAWVGIGTTVKGLLQTASVNRHQGEKVLLLPSESTPSRIADR
jgi:hypothetical protein